LIDSRSDEEVDSSDHSYDDGLKLLTETHHYQADAEDEMAAIVLASHAFMPMSRTAQATTVSTMEARQHNNEHDTHTSGARTAALPAN
jgi:hypothetical protein